MSQDSASSSDDAADFPVHDAKWEPESRTSRLREAVRKVGGNRAMSAKSGIPLGTLNGYLAGGEPKLSALIAIAEAAEVSLEWLAVGRGAPKLFVALGSADVGQNVQKPEPDSIALFATVNMDQLARAMLTAHQQFELRGGSPNWREMAQAVSLIYDMITAQETGRLPGEPGP